MSTYTEFFLASSSNVAKLELLEISHPSFTKTYRIVRNHAAGVTVTHEVGGAFAYDYYPLRIRGLGDRDDLDQGISVDLGDLGEILPLEMDAVMAAGTLDTKPTVKYREYRSDVLSAPLYGPLTLEMKGLSFTRQGASFEARAPELSRSATGELYSLDRFPMLRALL